MMLATFICYSYLYVSNLFVCSHLCQPFGLGAFLWRPTSASKPWRGPTLWAGHPRSRLPAWSHTTRFVVTTIRTTQLEKWSSETANLNAHFDCNVGHFNREFTALLVTPSSGQLVILFIGFSISVAQFQWQFVLFPGKLLSVTHNRKLSVPLVEARN